MTVAILATGTSLPGLLADLPPEFPCIAVNNAYNLRPTAVALVVSDLQWWLEHPEAHDFAGRKFCSRRIPGAEVPKSPVVPLNGLNSGALAMLVAHQLGYRRMLLLGFDGHGGHYHGDYKPPLKNSGPAQFKLHHRQFELVRMALDADIVNCTPGSAITAFRASTLRNEI